MTNINLDRTGLGRRGKTPRWELGLPLVLIGFLSLPMTARADSSDERRSQVLTRAVDVGPVPSVMPVFEAGGGPAVLRGLPSGLAAESPRASGSVRESLEAVSLPDALPSFGAGGDLYRPRVEEPFLSFDPVERGCRWMPPSCEERECGKPRSSEGEFAGSPEERGEPSADLLRWLPFELRSEYTADTAEGSVGEGSVFYRHDPTDLRHLTVYAGITLRF